MTNVTQLGLEILQRFEMLPLLTQWAVALLIVSGFIVHVFAYNERTAHDAPSIFTTGGIFFTFLGIAEGLISFDVHNVEASVPTLLSSLQTAFVSSVVGVFFALTIKMRLALFGVRSRTGSSSVQGATVDDLCNQMHAVEQALVGEEDSTLLSQVKLLRQDTNDRLDVLRRSHDEFAAKMADNNSKALISALEAVIRDFNAKISEQFGENFKRLNEAVVLANHKRFLQAHHKNGMQNDDREDNIAIHCVFETTRSSPVKGMRWYGRTLHGAYVCEREADAAGDRATRNGQ